MTIGDVNEQEYPFQLVIFMDRGYQYGDFNEKGLTRRTLCGIVLFKLNTFFSHVFACP